MLENKEEIILKFNLFKSAAEVFKREHYNFRKLVLETGKEDLIELDKEINLVDDYCQILENIYKENESELN